MNLKTNTLGVRAYDLENESQFVFKTDILDKISQLKGFIIEIQNKKQNDEDVNSGIFINKLEILRNETILKFKKYLFVPP
jgi:hypothetical protein